MSLLAFFSSGVLARRAVHARLEMQIAEPAFSAARNEGAHAVPRQVGDALVRVGVVDDRANGHSQYDVVAAVSVLVRAASVLASFRTMDAGVAIVDQRG